MTHFTEMRASKLGKHGHRRLRADWRITKEFQRSANLLLTIKHIFYSWLAVVASISSFLKTSGPVERPSPLCFLLCGGATSNRHNTNKADSYTPDPSVDACVWVCRTHATVG